MEKEGRKKVILLREVCMDLLVFGVLLLTNAQQLLCSILGEIHIGPLLSIVIFGLSNLSQEVNEGRQLPLSRVTRR